MATLEQTELRSQQQETPLSCPGNTPLTPRETRSLCSLMQQGQSSFTQLDRLCTDIPSGDPNRTQVLAVVAKYQNTAYINRVGQLEPDVRDIDHSTLDIPALIKTVEIGEQALDELVVRHIFWAKRVVSLTTSFPTPAADDEDRLQDAMVGILQALPRYNPDLGSTTTAYSFLRAKGAVVDGMRGLIPIPRSAWARMELIKRTTDKFRRSYGRSPTVAELAEKTGLTGEKINMAMVDTQMINPWSLDLPPGQDGYSGDSVDPISELILADPTEEPQAILSTKEEYAKLRRFVQRLPKPLSLVLGLYYNLYCENERELTMKEISDILGVSESRVSQLHKQALSILRNNLKAQESSLNICSI